MITQLEINKLRNINELHVGISSGVSLFLGPNGAGKTTILDAVHLLGTGKSFTTSQSLKAIQEGCSGFRVVGRLRFGGSETVVGLSRLRGGGGETRLAGGQVKTLSTLARELPIVLLNTDTLNVLREGPEARRRLIDQVVFHVEQSYGGIWQRYSYALKQRNALLRRGISDDKAWISELAALGEELHAARARAALLLSEALALVITAMNLRLPAVRLSLSSGWKQGLSLAEALEMGRVGDLHRGYTQIGPHRGDLHCHVGGVLAQDGLSRGQMKVLMSAVRIAQGRVLAEATRRPPVFLLDDVGSELDPAGAEAIFSLLAASGSQVLGTAVFSGDIPTWVGDGGCRMFHVEQGMIIDAN